MPFSSEVFEKTNDYTLVVSQKIDGGKSSEPTLRRIFNFKARMITHLYERGTINDGGSGFTSNMVLQKFSELDSQEEVELMHAILVKKGGKPPALRKSEEGPQSATPPGLG